MTLKDQLKTVKENWLIALVLLVLVCIPLFSGTNLVAKSFGASGMVEEMAVAKASYGVTRGGYYPGYESDFAPEVQDRLITKTAYLSSEIPRGEFKLAEDKLKNIVKTADGYLLNENIYSNGEAWKATYSGSYQIKVESKKYGALVSQLKEIGKVTSFSENAEDITGRVTDLKKELQLEQEKLARYKQMYEEATLIADKITLNDQIINQERTIAYYQDALKNQEQRVSYSTISVQLNERASGYANVALVKLSELVQKLVNSFNSLLALLFWALPWAVAVLVIGLIVRAVKKKK